MVRFIHQSYYFDGYMNGGARIYLIHHLLEDIRLLLFLLYHEQGCSKYNFIKLCKSVALFCNTKS